MLAAATGAQMAYRGIGLFGVGTVLLVTSVSAQRPARDGACLTVVDASGRYAIAGARITFADPRAVSGAVTLSDSTGRGCIAGRDSAEVRVDAVGFVPVSLALATGGAPQVRMQALPEGMMDAEWGSAQLVTALAQALRRPEIARDSAVTAVLGAVLHRADSVPLQVTVTRDSTSVLVFGYVDLTADGSRTGEVRMRFNGRQSIVLGVTTTRCGESCARECDVAVSWAPRQGAGWAMDLLARKDVGGEVTRVELDPALADDVSLVGTLDAERPSNASVTNIRGVVRNEKGEPIPGIEVFSADGSASTLTDERGAYRLAMRVLPGGALITTRRLGWAPVFRKVSQGEGSPLEWNPQLKSTTVLATELVRSTAVPEILRSWRYNDFNSRRARGDGQFFAAQEIWSAISLGDLINRGRGMRAVFMFGNRLRKIVVPSCLAFDSTVGVYVDGIEQTGGVELLPADPEMREKLRGMNSDNAVDVMTRYVNSAVVGMEIYVGRSEIPAEYANPRYCAVIGLWLR